MLLATNGTLTRTLGIVVNDEIYTEIVDQDIHASAPEMSSTEQHFNGRTIRRKVLLRGRSSGKVFVVAESVIAIDIVPSKLVDNLIEMDGPIGESILANGIEIFKETPKFWMDKLPDWSNLEGCEDMSQEVITRQYRMTIRSQPAIVITEYFPQSAFIDTDETATVSGEGNGAEVDMDICDCSCKEAVRQQMAGR
ncbi:chorismate--pyruvate lyase family protein [Mycobacterium angelicum]|uniref:chorismate--pyruvate lyase family protein n=1 Tax=Mycobacterium angelicum TaxID=470074 RepID=UPI0021F306B1|nr:chorismate pyruvate-lyase family protein [Mycobacterium angelicum]